jgi:hypothetical protein
MERLGFYKCSPCVLWHLHTMASHPHPHALQGQSGSAMWMTAMKNGTSEYLPYVRVVHNVEWIATNVTVGGPPGAGFRARRLCYTHCA